MSFDSLPLIVLALLMLGFAALVGLYLRENRRLEREVEALSETCKTLKRAVAAAKAAQSDALRQSDFYRLASEFAPDGIVVQNMSGRILWSNPAFSRIHQRPAEEVLGKHPLEFALPPDRTPAAEDLATFAYDPQSSGTESFEVIENQRGNGEMFWNQISLSFAKSCDGDDIAIQVCRDISALVAQTDKLQAISRQLEHRSKHDELTGASNRGAFLDYFEEVVGDPDQAPVGVLHIDLDNFKTINDTYGHAAGDAVLVHVTKILQNNVRPSDMVSRIGGDEFVVTCPRTSGLDALGDLSDRLLTKLAEPIDWCGNPISCGASIGAAISGENPDAEDLLAKADFALYEAKRGGRNAAAVYDTPMHNRHETQLKRTSEFADALKTEALDCFFQPKMALDTGEIIGVEALIRWDHPRDGLIPPDELLPIAKGLGLMAELDLRSMGFAIREQRKLVDAGFEDVNVAFNASPELLQHPDFMDRLVWEVDQADIERARITVEVLETIDFGNTSAPSPQATTIRQLHKAGFQIHLDDFGVGFAGLSHLAALNVTGVKLDRSLVAGLLSDKTSQTIVSKIIELSNDLNLDVVAEGVENAETAGMLQDMGCNTIQGYWLAKPMRASALHSWLEVRQRQKTRAPVQLARRAR